MQNFEKLFDGKYSCSKEKFGDEAFTCWIAIIEFSGKTPEWKWFEKVSTIYSNKIDRGFG